MNLTMTGRDLQLSLQASATVPLHLNWRIEDGYLRLCSWGELGEPFGLGVWGPGDVVIPSLIGISPLQLLALSPVRLEAIEPSTGEREQFLLDHSLQTATLLRISRTRPADARLLLLLRWIGERFGRVSSRGISLSLDDMYLTHRRLGEICGLTRVTVTKAFTQFRQEGYLIKEGADELLLPEALQILQRPDKEEHEP